MPETKMPKRECEEVPPLLRKKESNRFNQNGDGKPFPNDKAKTNQSVGAWSSIARNMLSEGELLQKLLDLVIKNKLAFGDNSDEKVVNFKHPHELKEILDLDVTAEGVNQTKEVNNILDQIIAHSVRTRHPNFYNQLYGGVDEVGLCGAWLVEALNTNQYTFEVAPVLVLIEHYIINFLVQHFGWKEGDGIFNPGGSMSNMYGMALARHKFSPELKKTGIFNTKPLVVFTSDQSHYSMKKAACFMGLGLDQVVQVETDSTGKMIAESLMKEIKRVKSEGRQPFFVNATAGSTVLGSYDPLQKIAQVCQSEGLWLHVDACWGGGVILSKKHKHLLAGIEMADSVAWNPHKMTCAPLQCSAFLVRHKGLLHDTNCSGASYLFQQDKFYDVSYDTGDKSVQCGRKPDAVKFWFMLKLHGTDYIEENVNKAFEAARYLESQIRVREGFELVLENHECTNVCFWYIPKSLRGLPRTQAWWEQVEKIAPTIKERITLSGSLMVGYQPIKSKGLVNFFRMVVTTSPEPTFSDMDYVLNQIEKNGFDL